MTISYKKLWIMLAEREMSKAELRRLAGLSPATLTKLRRNQSVSMEVLMKIAEVTKEFGMRACLCHGLQHRRYDGFREGVRISPILGQSTQ